MRIVLFINFCLLFPCLCLAQKQGNNWFFGYQLGLDFNSNPPTMISGNTGTSGSDQEGTAAISDTGGRLLFYTDGQNIFNSRHAYMANGQSIGGFLTAQQSSIIIPLPGSDSLYYVFTSDAGDNFKTWLSPPRRPAGYNYSIVDMSLDRKSIDTTLGAVIAGKKNIHLVDSGTEKLCAASDGVNGYWVLGHRMFSDSFIAWHLNSAGISSPVVTRIGPVLGSIDTRGNVYGSNGQMKFSPDGKKVATVNYDNDDSTSTLDLFDFNSLTGQLSNHCQALLRTHTYGPESIGLEFWPDGSKLFINDRVVGANYMCVLQFNLGGNCLSFANSKDTIAKRARRYYPYSIQAGTDSNLYVAYRDNLLDKAIIDRITKPDGTGSQVRYDSIVYSWSNQTVNYLPHLPSFVAGFRYRTFKLSVPANTPTESVRVSPNPVAGIFSISATGAKNQKFQTVISDMAGRVLFQATLPAHLDMSAQPPGLYFYRVYGAEGMLQAGKFWVQH
ncbi:MAG: T9SS type A sorting domain-containing protein [Bacteroidetes bacterium]|nr:T9SS type A sorting domain-containing protein [Bacteroidota bacterium]MBS1630104.1 T9SS type A sorting domain-containing protein [Bacteroidota bacterium]